MIGSPVEKGVFLETISNAGGTRCRPYGDNADPTLWMSSATVAVEKHIQIFEREEHGSSPTSFWVSNRASGDPGFSL